MAMRTSCRARVLGAAGTGGKRRGVARNFEQAIEVHAAFDRLAEPFDRGAGGWRFHRRHQPEMALFDGEAAVPRQRAKHGDARIALYGLPHFALLPGRANLVQR